MTSVDLEQLTGDELRQQLHLDRSAVDNWSRYADGPEDYDAARGALLEAIEAEGRLTATHPAWMTSPKAGVDLWLHLPGGLALTVRRDERPSARRPLRVTNALAPRRGAKGSSAPRTTREAVASDDELERLSRLTPAELVEQVRLSAHAVDRVQDRLPAARELQDPDGARAMLLEAITSSGRVATTAPGRADAASTRGPALMVELAGELLALPLRANSAAGHPEAQRWVATTTLAERWVHEDLLLLRGASLVERMRPTSGALKAWRGRFGLADEDEAREHLLARVREQGEAVVGDPAGLEVLLDDLRLRLRPASTTAQAEGHPPYAIDKLLGERPVPSEQ